MNELTEEYEYEYDYEYEMKMALAAVSTLDSTLLISYS
jgi:hypothetical protein